MSYRCVWLLVLILGMPSCDKGKQVLVQVLSQKKEAVEPAAPSTPYSGSLVTQIEPESYDSFIQQSGSLIIIDYYADWCGPCRMLGPILDEIAHEHGGKVLLGKVNVDQCKELAAKAGVSGIPDVRIFIDGKQVDRFVGAPPADQVKILIEKQLGKLPQAKPVASAEPEPKVEPKEPAPTPMDKDWLPPGMKHR